MHTIMRTYLWILLLIVMTLPLSTVAETYVVLPGVSGAYVEGHESGVFSIVGSEAGGESHLRVVGHLSLGTFWACDTDTVIPWGSEINLFISPEAEAFELAHVFATVPALAGPFVLEVPLESSMKRRVVNLFAAPGSWRFDCYIGYHPDGNDGMCYIFSPGEIVIESALITANIGVQNEEASWSSIKWLFR